MQNLYTVKKLIGLSVQLHKLRFKQTHYSVINLRQSLLSLLVLLLLQYKYYKNIVVIL